MTTVEEVVVKVLAYMLRGSVGIVSNRGSVGSSSHSPYDYMLKRLIFFGQFLILGVY